MSTKPVVLTTIQVSRVADSLPAAITLVERFFKPYKQRGGQWRWAINAEYETVSRRRMGFASTKKDALISAAEELRSWLRPFSTEALNEQTLVTAVRKPIEPLALSVESLGLHTLPDTDEDYLMGAITIGGVHFNVHALRVADERPDRPCDDNCARRIEPSGHTACDCSRCLDAMQNGTKDPHGRLDDLSRLQGDGSFKTLHIPGFEGDWVVWIVIGQ